MKCKLPMNKFENTRITRKGIELPIILTSDKKKLPEYLQIGQAWKVFGKWMVAMGQSDQNEIEFPDGELKSGHVCIVLRGIGFTLYFYELIDDYTEENYLAFDNIRYILDKILVTNQAASYRLRYFLEKNNWKGSIFPKFFNKFDKEKILKWSDDIDNEIEKYSNIKFKFKKIKKNEYWKKITNPKKIENLWNIKSCYIELLSAFNTLKNNLPQENIQIIEELITRCEHGYFLAYLVDKTIKEFDPNLKFKDNRSSNYLIKRLKKFRKGREERVKLASKEAFGLTPEVLKKLDRMFLFI